jgi:D-alanyl-D-alanine carboxypeptidase (penicillin-binding protein 5/6)
MKSYRRKKKLKAVKLIFLQLLLILMVVVLSKGIYRTAETKLDNSATPLPTASLPSGKETNSDKVYSADLLNAKEKSLASTNAILVRLSDQKVLLDKNSKERIYPASLTKIMTAIVAIENLDDFDQPVTLSSSIFQPLYDEDASMAGFLPDETVPAIDLLYGVLLPSGAECCVGLSDYIAGSEDAFVDLMNNKADELGMSDTHFTNSTGLNDKNHYTTVADLAILLKYALQNDTFREIFTSSKHSVKAASLHPDGITFFSTMFEKMDSPKLQKGSILGGKTGYTSEAGLCLASLARIDGEEYILVTAGAKGNHDTKQYHLKDAFYVYNSLK